MLRFKKMSQENTVEDLTRVKKGSNNRSFDKIMVYHGISRHRLFSSEPLAASLATNIDSLSVFDVNIHLVTHKNIFSRASGQCHKKMKLAEALYLFVTMLARVVADPDLIPAATKFFSLSQLCAVALS